MKSNSVRRMALIDISKDTVFTYDEETIKATQLNTKENRILNKRLGIKNINYKKHKDEK